MAKAPARNPASHWGRVAAGVLVAWVLILGAIIGIGKLLMITKNGNGNVLGDRTIPHWFAAHRTPSLTPPGTRRRRVVSMWPSRSWSSGTSAAGGGTCS